MQCNVQHIAAYRPLLNCLNSIFYSYVQQRNKKTAYTGNQFLAGNRGNCSPDYLHFYRKLCGQDIQTEYSWFQYAFTPKKQREKEKA